MNSMQSADRRPPRTSATTSLVLCGAAAVILLLAACRSSKTSEAPPEQPPDVPRIETDHPAVRVAVDEHQKLARANAQLTVRTEALPKDKPVEVMKDMGSIVRQLRINNQARTQILQALLDMTAMAPEAQTVAALRAIRDLLAAADLDPMREADRIEDIEAAYQKALLDADIRPVDLMFDVPADHILRRLTTVAARFPESKDVAALVNQLTKRLD